jgi:hypothetical protein
MAACVRLKRGAGPGWGIPATSTNVPRWTLWGWATASGMVRTGAKHTSVPSMISHHSSRVLVRKIPARRSFSAGHWARSCCHGRSSPSRPVRRSSSA